MWYTLLGIPFHCSGHMDMKGSLTDMLHSPTFQMAVQGERKYTMTAYNALRTAIAAKIKDTHWTARMVKRALWSSYVSAGKQRTKVGAIPKFTAKSSKAFRERSKGGKDAAEEEEGEKGEDGEEADYTTLKVAQLRALLKARGLSHTGKKALLIKRLEHRSVIVMGAGRNTKRKEGASVPAVAQKPKAKRPRTTGS